jgi:hypothetical protein
VGFDLAPSTLPLKRQPSVRIEVNAALSIGNERQHGLTRDTHKSKLIGLDGDRR